MLTLSLATGSPDTDVAVVVQIRPLLPTAEVDAHGWPAGYFDRVVGSMPDLERAPQGQFEERLPLE